jgi:hypothetical protein
MYIHIITNLHDAEDPLLVALSYKECLHKIIIFGFAEKKWSLLWVKHSGGGGNIFCIFCPYGDVGVF